MIYGYCLQHASRVTGANGDDRCRSASRDH
jgi:hypothetical protein